MVIWILTTSMDPGKVSGVTLVSVECAKGRERQQYIFLAERGGGLLVACMVEVAGWGIN
jgi:hypothetical protein